ncbi:MAG: hypothetical protein JXR95_15670 [Deltaproteobacteria bacterium]|nr:hypothetical protein [Deltaproteobacteria bacterium]
MSIIKQFTGYGYDRTKFQKEASKSITRELLRTYSRTDLRELPSVTIHQYKTDINSTVSINNTSRKLNDYLRQGNDKLSGLQTAQQALDSIEEKLSTMLKYMSSENADPEVFSKITSEGFQEIDNILRESSYNGQVVFQKEIQGSEPLIANRVELFSSDEFSIEAKNGLSMDSVKDQIHSRAVIQQAIEKINGERQNLNTSIDSVSSKLSEVLVRNEAMFGASMDHFDLQLMSQNYEAAKFQILSNPGNLVEIHNFSTQALDSLV